MEEEAPGMKAAAVSGGHSELLRNLSLGACQMEVGGEESALGGNAFSEIMRKILLDLSVVLMKRADMGWGSWGLVRAEDAK